MDGILAREYRAVTACFAAIMFLTGFAALAVVPTLPAAADLHGAALFPLVAGCSVAAGLLGGVLGGTWSDRAGAGRGGEGGRFPGGVALSAPGDARGWRVAGRWSVGLLRLGVRSARCAIETTLLGPCVRTGFHPGAECEVAGWTAELGLVAVWLGITLIPSPAARAARPDLAPVPLHPDDTPIRHVHTATRRGRRPPRPSPSSSPPAHRGHRPAPLTPRKPGRRATRPRPTVAE